MIIVLSDHQMEKLERGEIVEMDLGPVVVNLASERWVEKGIKEGYIKEKYIDKDGQERVLRRVNIEVI